VPLHAAPKRSAGRIGRRFCVYRTPSLLLDA